MSDECVGVIVDVAGEIAALHDRLNSCARTTIADAIRIGELLTEQKARLPHGAWLPWVRDALPFSEWTARNYMRMHSDRAKLESGNVLDLTDAYRLLAGPKKRAPKKLVVAEAPTETTKQEPGLPEDDMCQDDESGPRCDGPSSSPRTDAVKRLWLSGRTNDEIANELGVSRSTVFAEKRRAGLTDYMTVAQSFGRDVRNTASTWDMAADMFQVNFAGSSAEDLDALAKSLSAAIAAAKRLSKAIGGYGK